VAEQQIARQEKRDFVGISERAAECRGGKQGNGKARVGERTFAARTRFFGDHFVFPRMRSLAIQNAAKTRVS